VRAAATAGRAAQPVGFAHPFLADPNGPDYHADHPDCDADHPDCDADNPDRDSRHPNRSGHDANTDTNHDEPVAGSEGKRHHRYLQFGRAPLGHDLGKGDHSADPHAEIESRRRAHEDDEGTSQQHPNASPISARYSNPGHR
jgi:hypothetical protein